MGTVEFAFELRGLPPILLNSRMNYYKRSRINNDWYARVYFAVKHQRPPFPCHTARVKIVRFSSTEPDFDGLVSAGKPLLDGLVRAGVLEDDRTSVIGQPTYLWEQAAPKQGRVLVSVVGEWRDEEDFGGDAA